MEHASNCPADQEPIVVKSERLPGLLDCTAHCPLCGACKSWQEEVSDG